MVQERELAITEPEIFLSDSLPGSDTLTAVPEPVYGILLTPPAAPPEVPQRENSREGISFILGGLIILFLIIALRFRNNAKYAVAMFQNLVETRTRQNVFNDTVRETSLIVLLNVMWCVCTGIIGFCVFDYIHPLEIPRSEWSIGMLYGMGIAAVYTLFLWLAYALVGWVFSNKTKSQLWVKGFSANQALMSPAFFVIALVVICRPDTAWIIGILSAVVFITGKLIFIWKGYRIFFNQFSSWVLFLCYLCSLEIVPLILCYRGAVLLGEVLG